MTFASCLPLAVLAAFAPPRPSPADEAPAAVRAWIGEHAHPLEAWDDDTDAASRDAGLEALAPLLEGVRIVGLGEATHGSHEIFRTKHRVFANLVEHHGVRALGIEAGFAESLELDAYVRGGGGAAGNGGGKDALRVLGPFPYFTEELLDLVEWLRRHNEALPAEQRVRLLGLDTGSTALSARRLARYLESVDEEYRDETWSTGVEISSLLTALAARRNPSDRDGAAELLRLLGERFEAERELWSEDQGEDAYRIADQLRTTLLAIFEAKGEDPDRRDRSMAERARWIADSLVPDGRVVLWMHDAHIARNGLGLLKSSGGFLAESIGAQYRAFGTAFGSGGFRAIFGGRPAAFEAQASPADGFDGAFAATGHALSWWNLREAAQDEAMAAWLGTSLSVNFAGGAHQEGAATTFTTPMTDAYDALFFVNAVTASRPIDG